MINPSDIIAEPFIICAAWKELGKRKIHSVSVTKKEAIARDDSKVVAALHKMVEDADVLVAHNGDRFDLTYLKSRCLKHGTAPLSHVITVDTLKTARREFGRLPSKRLDFIGKYLGFGGKIGNTPGLWGRCEAGDKKALADMLKYNKRDVELLEKVYLKLRPWMANHPNLELMSMNRRNTSCKVCLSHDIIKYGRKTNTITMWQLYQCKGCGHRFKGETIKRY
jgi:DNA polymerase III epsilon subunit-like protein